VRRRWWLPAGVLVVVLAAGLFAGLNTGSSGDAAGTPQTASTAGTATSATTESAIATDTQPVVKIEPSTTTIPESSLPGYKRPTIQLGDMNTPEQFVLGELYSVALSEEGYRVNVSRNIGPTYISQPALKQGSLDIYPEYLDVWNTDIAHIDTPFTSTAQAYAAASAYATKHGFVLLTPTPGSDNPGLAVTTQLSRENHLQSLADLAHAPLLTFGVPLGVNGLARAESTYGFQAGLVQPILTGAQFGALDAGAVQVAYVGSTEPELSESRFTLLADPDHVYGFGNIVPVTTAKVVAAEGPAFVEIIDQVDALLSTKALQGLNSEVGLKGHSQTSVAEQFLQGNGVLPPSQYSVAG
jgi:osmoprotectant transport system substrate-binding protein